MSKEDPRLIPIQRALVHETAVTANTDILSADIAPTKPPAMFRIMISVSGATRFEVDITYDSTESTNYFNSGVDLIADCLYIFDMLVADGDTMNFQVNDSITINILRVFELPAAL